VSYLNRKKSITAIISSSVEVLGSTPIPAAKGNFQMNFDGSLFYFLHNFLKATILILFEAHSNVVLKRIIMFLNLLRFHLAGIFFFRLS